MAQRNTKLSQFNPVTTEEVARLISYVATKSCELDAIPTSGLKQINTKYSAYNN